MRNFVVTGGAGFIGSNIVAQLEARGAERIFVVDHLGSDEKWRNIAKRSIYGIFEPEEIYECLDACRMDAAVIHMGAITSTTERDASKLARFNADLTASLFETCAERRWPFIYASSAAVYGSGGSQMDLDGIDAMAELRPSSAYGWSKLLADKMIVQRARLDLPDMPEGGRVLAPPRQPPLWAGLRFFNVYGPGEAHKGEQRSFVTRCFDAIQAGEKIKVFRGSDRFFRDWVYVADCARLVVDLLMPPRGEIRSVGGIFNVGTGRTTSFTSVAQACIEASAVISSLETVPFPIELSGQYQANTRADITKLQTVLPGFRFSDLESGLQSYWGGYAKRQGADRFP